VLADGGAAEIGETSGALVARVRGGSWPILRVRWVQRENVVSEVRRVGVGAMSGNHEGALSFTVWRLWASPLVVVWRR